MVELSNLKRYLNIPVTIGLLIGFFIFFRWIGWKGMLGMIIGMAIMAYLLLSKNIMLKWAIDMAKGNEYIEEVKK